MIVLSNTICAILYVFLFYIYAGVYMYVCVCICMYICVCTYMYVRVCMYGYICIILKKKKKKKKKVKKKKKKKKNLLWGKFSIQLNREKSYKNDKHFSCHVLLEMCFVNTAYCNFKVHFYMRKTLCILQFQVDFYVLISFARKSYLL